MLGVPRPRARSTQIPVAINWSLWLRGYHLAIVTAMVFFLSSYLLWTVEARSLPPYLFGPLALAAGFFCSFVMMVRSGGSLAAVAWFVLGSGIFFGAGPTMWGLLPDIHPLLFFSEKSMAEDLRRINLLNSVSVLLVLLAAYPIATGRRPRSRGNSPLHVDWHRFYKLILPLVAISILLQYAFFPRPQDLLLRNLLSNLKIFVPVFFLLTGLLWSRLSLINKIMALPLLTAEVVWGTLAFSKTAIMLPILSLLGGIWISRNSVKRILFPSVVVCAAYFLFVAPIIGKSRHHRSYDPVNDSMLDRAQILSEAVGEAAPEEETLLWALGRFSHGPIQAYLIDEYLSGRPGESLADFWAALVPRIFWPEKPIITRFGAELDGLYKHKGETASALAPTYSAEAYWTYGAWGCFLVSILLGLEVGWLTRRWFVTMEGSDDAFLMIAFPAAIISFNVETWIAASYGGGFITLVILWLGFRFLLRHSGLRATPDVAPPQPGPSPVRSHREVGARAP